MRGKLILANPAPIAGQGPTSPSPLRHLEPIQMVIGQSWLNSSEQSLMKVWIYSFSREPSFEGCRRPCLSHTFSQGVSESSSQTVPINHLNGVSDVLNW